MMHKKKEPAKFEEKRENDAKKSECKSLTPDHNLINNVRWQVSHATFAVPKQRRLILQRCIIHSKTNSFRTESEPTRRQITGRRLHTKLITVYEEEYTMIT